MNDQYDYYCFEKIREASHKTEASSYEAESELCACARYLHAEGYETLSEITGANTLLASCRIVP